MRETVHQVMEIEASVPSTSMGIVAHIDCELLRTRPASEWLDICKREAAPYAERLKGLGEIEWSAPRLKSVVSYAYPE